MKKPRDILFARHVNAEPKLDAIRREMVAGLNHQDTKTPSLSFRLVSWCLGGFRKLWQELYFPSRRIWSGLATVWALILLVNFAEREPVPAGKISAAPVMISFREQQRWMNELFAERAPVADAEPPKTFSPKPRTETLQTFFI